MNNFQYLRLKDIKWATKVTIIKSGKEKDNEESEPVTLKETWADANSELMIKCSGKKTTVTTQIEEIKGSLDRLNEKLMEVMAMMQRNFDNIERMNDDTMILKEDLVEIKQNLGDTDMKSLKLELKSCLTSYHDIKKDNSVINGKLYKIYGRDFFNR